MNEFGNRIAQATCTHIMYEQDWIVICHGRASVDNLLSPTLYFGIVSLNGGKVLSCVSSAMSRIECQEMSGSKRSP